MKNVFWDVDFRAAVAVILAARIPKNGDTIADNEIERAVEEGALVANEMRRERVRRAKEEGHEQKEALLVLRVAGWRPLKSSGGVPVGGLSKTVRREDALELELSAVAILLAHGWEQAHEVADYPWIPTLIAPPNRAHEYLFEKDG